MPFVGRKLELDILLSALGEVLGGQSHFVLLTAAAGLGKTRLTQEFLSRASKSDCQILRGYCESYLSAEPLQPFLQILRAQFGLHRGVGADQAAKSMQATLAALDPALAMHLGDFQHALLLGGAEAGAGRASPSSVVGALRDLVAALASKKPLILYIDDWQWADDASNQVLAAIRTIPSCRLMILLATRPIGSVDAPVGTTRVIELAPFADPEAEQTITYLLPRADPFLVTEIGRHAGGNPLFIEELCHSVAHDDGLRRLGTLQAGAAWLNHLVESRLERLPAAQADLVRAAAVIGNVIPAWLLEQLTGCGEGHHLLRALAEQDFIFPGEQAGTLRFKHGITRDVIYNAIGLHVRRSMHRRIAEALCQQEATMAREEGYEALAYHFGAGGDAERAAHFAELAGDKAVAASALDRAKRQYRAALAALDDCPPSTQRAQRWISIAQRLGLVCVFDAARPDLAIFERAVALASQAGDAAAGARSRHWLGYISYSLGDARDAIAHCQDALAAARQVGDEPLAAQILATLGQAHTAACNYPQALRLLDEAIAVKRQHRSGKRTAVGLAFSLVCRAWILGDRGDFAQAYECFDEALECVVGFTHEIGASVHGWRGAVLLWQGRWVDAGEAAAESARIAERTRSLFQLSIARAIGGYADWMLTGRDGSLRAIADATDWLEPRAGGLFSSLNHGWLTDGLVNLGHHAQARHHAARALMRARKLDLLGVAMTHRALARAAAAEGRPVTAGHYLAQAMRTARARDSAHEIAVTRWCDAAIAGRLDDRQRALALLDEAQPAFESMAMPWHLAEAAKLRSALSSGAG